MTWACMGVLERRREFSIAWWVIVLLGHSRTDVNNPGWCVTQFLLRSHPPTFPVLSFRPPGGGDRPLLASRRSCTTDLYLAAASRTQMQCQRLSGRWSEHLPSEAAQRGPQTNSPPPANKQSAESQTGFKTYKGRKPWQLSAVMFVGSVQVTESN